jgi:hypothetical protein
MTRTLPGVAQQQAAEGRKNRRIVASASLLL